MPCPKPPPALFDSNVGLSSPHALYGLNFVHDQFVEVFLVGHFDHHKYVWAAPARIRHFDSRKDSHRTGNLAREEILTGCASGPNLSGLLWWSWNFFSLLFVDETLKFRIAM
jgi:hypothetical protein